MEAMLLSGPSGAFRMVVGKGSKEPRRCKGYAVPIELSGCGGASRRDGWSEGAKWEGDNGKGSRRSVACAQERGISGRLSSEQFTRVRANVGRPLSHARLGSSYGEPSPAFYYAYVMTSPCSL